MKRIALFTTFYEAVSGYSLIAVAETQIKMLLDNGYDPTVLVDENFQETGIWKKEIIDLRPVIPPLNSENLESKVYKALEENLADIDICMTHDIILQSFYVPHDKAMRKYAKTRDNLLWLNFIHSFQSQEKTKPSGYIIYPNRSDKNKIAKAYKTDRVISNRASHSIDPLKGYSQITKDLVEKSDFLAGEISAVFPARLDRGKNTEAILYLMAGIKYHGVEPRLLIIDWQSTGERFQKYIDELIVLAGQLNIQIDFTSRLDDRCNLGIPHEIVLELMDFSNIYIHPSKIETYSLVIHEAILRGNLVCLNFDLEMMRELYGNYGIYFDFGSDFNSREYEPNEATFWQDEARRLVLELKNNRALWAKNQAQANWNPKAMWSEFKGLLELELP